MHGQQATIEKCGEVASHRPHWNYAPSWISPDGVWHLPPEPRSIQDWNDMTHTKFCVEVPLPNGGVYATNFRHGYVRVSTPNPHRDIRDLSLEFPREHGLPSPKQREAILQAVREIKPTSFVFRGSILYKTCPKGCNYPALTLANVRRALKGEDVL